MLVTAFLVLGCMAFAIIVMWGLSKVATSVRPELWVVLFVLVVLAALSGTESRAKFGPAVAPTEPSKCTWTCSGQFAEAPNGDALRRECREACEAKRTP